MNEQLLAQIINGMRMNQPQGAVGNVTNKENSLFNMMAGNAMTGANIGGNVGNVSDNEAAVMAQAANEMKALQAKGAAGNGILTTDELNRFVYLRNMLNPNLPQEEPVDYNTMPVDIDGASAGNGMSQEALNALLQRLQRMR